MAVLIDPPRWPAHGTVWSHLVSDTSYEELHEFAARMRLPRRSFDFDHYDVAQVHYDRAVRLGAVPVSGHDLVIALRNSGLRLRPVDKQRVAPQRRREFLLSQWDSLGSMLVATDQRGWRAIGAQLLRRWSEPHRSYHNDQHLEDVLLALDHLGVLGERIQPTTLLAAWFHDAVYRGETGEDERASAALAVQLEPLVRDRSLVSVVQEFIIATIPNRAVVDAPLPLAHLLDADLAIFGASERRYDRYSLAVRDEYAHVPEAAFRAGREEILRGYVERPEIYRLPASRQLWESIARKNLAREIQQLAGPQGAGNSRR